MRIFLYGISSLSFWLSAPGRPKSTCAVSAKALRNCDPTAQSVAYLARAYPQIPEPYHVIVSSQHRDPHPRAITHVSVFAYADKPFYRIGNGVYASCPELCFVQLAHDLPFHELVKVGDALCGTFIIDPAHSNGLATRMPLTTKRRIEAYLRRNAGLRGAKAARRALASVTDGAASPPESFLRMVLGLPYRCGGYQLENLQANRRLRPSRKARAIAGRESLVPDLCSLEGRLAVEYDSNAEHLTERQIGRDASKRLALEADGYKVITVTKPQLADAGHMARVAVEAGRRLGRRVRPQSKKFPAQNRLLFQTGWSLGKYHRREWLAGAGSLEVAPAADGQPGDRHRPSE